MRLLYYDIQNPIDPQVNGLGIYRSAVDGVLPLLDKRVLLPDNSSTSKFTCTHPWEAADAGDREIIMVWTIASHFTFTNASRNAVVLPSDLVESTNFEGTFEYIDEGMDNHDNEWMTASDVNVNNDLTVNFGNLEGAILPTDDNQTFRWRARYQPGEKFTAEEFPTVRAELWEAGVLVRSGDEQTVDSATGQDFTFDWNSSEITAAADVQCKLVGTRFAGNTKKKSASVDINAVDWVSEILDTNPVAATASQHWEIAGRLHLNGEDDAGERATHKWEIAFRDLTQTRYTWAYASTLTDDGLGSAVEFDNDPPIEMSLATDFLETMFLSGDPNNPHYLYHSKRFRPESFPPLNFIEIGNADDPITAIVPIAGVLGMFTHKTKYRLTGNSLSGFVHFEAISKRGTRAWKSVVPSDKGIIFVAADGVFVTNLLGPDNKLSSKIEQLFTGDTVQDEEPINRDAFDEIAAGLYKNKYWFSYPAGTATQNNRTAVYDFDTEGWSIYDHAIASFFVEEDVDQFTAGDVDGFVKVLENGTTDDGTDDISFEARTKDFQGRSYNVRNLFLYFKVEADIPAGESLTAEFYVDDVLKKTTTVDGSRTNTLIGLPENTFGYRWRVHLTGSTHLPDFKIYGVAAMFIPLEAS